MGALMGRHAAAWMNDAWYRRAWFAFPQAFAVLLIGFLFTWSKAPDPPTAPMGWAHPSDNKARLAALNTLWQQAKTDPAAETLLLAKANAGDAFAQFFMGNLLDPTLDRAKANAERTKQAEDWYRKSAEQNFALAEADIGFLLAYPRFGAPADYGEAYNWLDKAAPNVPSAQRELGLMFLLGRGIPVDTAKGIQLLRSAADRGDPSAQGVIGDALDNGRYGLTVDRHEAVLFYQKAALQNSIFAQRQLAMHLQKGDGVAADADKAMAWFRRAAGNGDAFSKAQLNAVPATPAQPGTMPFSVPPVGR